MSLAIVCCATGLAWAFPHPFHTSVAELDWNSNSRRWEVSIRIHAGDLELALSQELRRQIDIEDKEAVPAIQDYLAHRFKLLPQSQIDAWINRPKPVTAADQSPVSASEVQLEAKTAGEDVNKPTSEGAKSVDHSNQIDWLGQELEGNWLWLYFEIDQPQIAAEPLALFSQLLTEVNEDQINIVSFRTTGKRVSRQTNRQQQWIALEPSSKHVQLGQ